MRKNKFFEYNQSISEEILVTKTITTTDEITMSRKNVGYKLLESIYSDLEISKLFNDYAKTHKFKYSLDEVMKLLVFGRILDPKSKFATVEEFQKMLFGNWSISYNDVDRSMDHFDKLKEDVQFLIHKSVSEKIGRTATLVFYDVTNYYWETDIDDEDEINESGEVVQKGLRKRGPSKEKRPNPIVQMGLFMDLNGIPIAYRLFEDNHTDPITYVPTIEQVKKQFGIDKDGWEYNHDMSFAKKSVVKPRKLSNGEMVNQKILVTWREKYAIREKIRRDGAIDFDAQFDGMNVIVTSETSMSDDEMIAAYGQLNRIEDCFRVIKTEFKARPAYVWTREHIEAHFLTCFIALVVLRIMQYQTSRKYSPRKLANVMKSMNTKPFAQGYYEVKANDDAIELLKRFEIDWNKELQPFDAINRLNKIKIMS